MDAAIDRAVSSYEKRQSKSSTKKASGNSNPHKKQDRGNIVTGGIKAINKAKQRRSSY